MTPFGPQGQRAQPRIRRGIISHYPVAGKVAGKPYITGAGQRSRGSSRTLGTVLSTSVISGSGPYLGPPDPAKEPDPGNTWKTRVFRTLLNTFFSDPLPLAPLFVKTCKKVVEKRCPLYRLLRLLLRTSKTARRVTSRHEKWPILWHISCFPKCGKSRRRVEKAITKLQRIIWRCP